MHKYWWVSLALLLAIGCPSNPSITAIKIYRQQYYNKKNPKVLQKWKTLAEEEIAKNPNNYVAYCYLGEAYIRLDSFTMGAEQFKKGYIINAEGCLKFMKDEDSTGYWNIFKRVTDELIQDTKFEKAEEFLNIAFRLIPNRSGNYTRKGFLILQEGDTTDAMKYYRKAIQLDTMNAEAAGQIGRIYSRKGINDSAFFYFKKADNLMKLTLDNAIKQIAPTVDIEKARNPVIRASILYEAKKKAEAQEVLATINITDFEKKERALENLSGIRFEIGSLLFEMGMTDYKQDSLAKALNRFKEVLNLRPRNTQAMYYAGISEYQLDNYKDAEKHFRARIDLVEDDFAGWFWLGAALAKQDNFEDAIEAFEKAKEINPKNPDVYKNLALSYSKIGKKKKAMEYYKKAEALQKEGK